MNSEYQRKKNLSVLNRPKSKSNLFRASSLPANVIFLSFVCQPLSFLGLLTWANRLLLLPVRDVAEFQKHPKSSTALKHIYSIYLQ